jgi:hypothetical protein
LFLLPPRLVFIKGLETNTVNHFGDGFWALVHKKAKDAQQKFQWFCSMVLSEIEPPIFFEIEI